MVLEFFQNLGTSITARGFGSTACGGLAPLAVMVGYCRAMKIHPGFTLIELMLVIVVLTIIVALGVPSFRSIIQNNRASTVTNDLVAGLQAARSEALKLRTNVSLCRRNAAGNACEDGTDWAVGWLVCSEACTAADVIRVWEPVPSDGAVTGPDAGITYRSTGAATGGGTFSVAFPGCTGNEQRNIVVLASGSLNPTRTACP